MTDGRTDDGVCYLRPQCANENTTDSPHMSAVCIHCSNISETYSEYVLLYTTSDPYVLYSGAKCVYITAAPLLQHCACLNSNPGSNSGYSFHLSAPEPRYCHDSTYRFYIFPEYRRYSSSQVETYIIQHRVSPFNFPIIGTFFSLTTWRSNSMLGFRIFPPFQSNKIILRCPSPAHFVW